MTFMVIVIVTTLVTKKQESALLDSVFCNGMSSFMEITRTEKCDPVFDRSWVCGNLQIMCGTIICKDDLEVFWKEDQLPNYRLLLLERSF